MTSIALPRPVFAEVDVATATQRLVARYEADSGRTLQPAQVERVLIDLIAYKDTLIRQAIQETGEQNLVAFARYPMLDHLAELVGLTRLTGSAAKTTLRFTLAGVQAVDTLIPAGTRVQSLDLLSVFATDADLTILAGTLLGDVAATASAIGAAANGYAVGQVSRAMDLIGGVATVSNTVATTDGADAETDDALRARVPLAWARFSVAGSRQAYRAHALAAHAAIIDVTVTSPTPGVVRVALLTNNGAPSPAVLAAATAALAADDVRPLTDTVEVTSSAAVDYSVAAEIRVLDTADAATVMLDVQAAAEAFILDRRSALGKDIVREQLIAQLMRPGVYSLTLTQPAASLVVDPDRWAHCTSLGLTQGAPVSE